ncbi:AraC family transcription regulator [Yersinia intermedia]|uniref:AraC family transcriptional regulator n=1 Tax=Yersinia intermedia TaxID=631 RepID=UPI0005E70E00|nr:AraC family transcriptional regulator N-terminal domain-containing protein [Yersinia intermedia]CNK39135.1 AraC family transcription regulator [Yersinia intermedia]
MDNQINEQMGRLRILAAQNKNGRLETGIPRVAMVQGAIPEHELATVYEPMINLILQGSKSMTVGEQTFDYDPATYFVMSVELPAVGVIRSDAVGEPYMAVALTLVPSILAELIADLPPGYAENRGNAFSVAAVTLELLDAWTRMLSLMVRPDDIAVLAPAYEREILYRVLQGPHGAMLRAIAAMSVSAFHRHFKAATSLSPVQYQKHIRLMHAHTLMVAKGYSVAAAAYDVGYESATQFSREYARLFGMAPLRDAARMLAHTQCLISHGPYHAGDQ